MKINLHLSLGNWREGMVGRNGNLSVETTRVKRRDVQLNFKMN
jgi:hypothetical protein